MLSTFPKMESGTISVNEGRFVLQGKPTTKDIKVFEEWRDRIEAEEREQESASTA